MIEFLLGVAIFCATVSLMVIAALEIGRYLAHRRYQRSERMSEAWLHRQARLTRTNGDHR